MAGGLFACSRVRAVEAEGGPRYAVDLDLAIATNVFELFDIAESTFGRLNVLVNNAAHCRSDTFFPYSDANAMMREQHRGPRTTK